MTRAKSPLKSITLSSGRFRITRVDCAGCVQGRKLSCKVRGEINIVPTTNKKDELDTWVHEAMHGEFPRMTEPRIAKAATNLARLLWRVGYRKGRQ